MAKLDYKVTIWRRVHIDDDLTEEIIQKLKSGYTGHEIEEEYMEKMEFNSEYISETEEEMVPDENGGQPTIEFFGDTPKGEKCFINGKIG